MFFSRLLAVGLSQRLTVIFNKLSRPPIRKYFHEAWQVGRHGNEGATPFVSMALKVCGMRNGRRRPYRSLLQFQGLQAWRFPKILQNGKGRKKGETTRDLTLKIEGPDAAGIDVADTEMQVCVPPGHDAVTNRHCGSSTRDLGEISEWLRRCGVRTVAMEATCICWLPLYFRLEEDGLEVRNISGKKTDRSDIGWLCLLHSHGPLRPTLQPSNVTRRVRSLCRHRSGLLQTASRETRHMQKAMEQMDIKLSDVLRTLSGCRAGA